MKKSFLFILLFIGASTVVKAQINFGVKAGYNLSTVKFANEKLDSKSFFYAGGLVEYPLSPKVALQGELLYTQIGGKMGTELVQLVGNEVVNMGTTYYNYQFSQLQIPISIKYSFIPKLSASVGMNFAFNLSSKVKTTFMEENTHDFEGLKTLNLYPFLGAEFKFNEKFFMDARYNFNFINMTEGNGIPIKAGFLQAGVGYRFR
ncbi:porin family protein [Chryseobacterium paridis]|uniref:PorT family protein n=1 Tax=Chryseobacterium paridis TaxID=2800328 RepID=A0ABS1FSX1_9FLAO|nr:porin family protein [Chryseobacterium paridis]MBK1895517.1 PorT family protein [Chryseobacterium paridis]